MSITKLCFPLCGKPLNTFLPGYSDYEILCRVVEKVNEVIDYSGNMAIEYANPLNWDITTQYSQNTVVVDPKDGTAYLSVKPVPAGVQLSDTSYWTPIFTLKNFTDFLKLAITALAQQENGQPASIDIPANSVFFVGDILCTNKDTISIGSLVIVGSNCRQVSIIEIIAALASLPTAWYNESDTSINMAFSPNKTIEIYAGDAHTYSGKRLL